MPKTPVAVTAAEWKKAKPVTLKDPGLDKKLADWEKAKKDLDSTLKMANIQKCASTLGEVVKMSKTTLAGANKTLHKDGIAWLEGYPAAVAKISQGLQKAGADYSKKVDAWNKKRVDCLAGMKKAEPVGKQLVAKFDSTKQTCDASVGTENEKRAAALAARMLKEINDFKAKAIQVMDIVRIADNNASINVDDRDQKYIDMFTSAINIQSSLEGNFRAPIAYLEKYVNDYK